MPCGDNAAPAWLVDYDAAFQGKHDELAAVDTAAAERRTQVAASASGRTVRVGGEGKTYAPLTRPPDPGKSMQAGRYRAE